MTWQVLCAAQSSTVPNADLSIEAAELARADAKVIPGLCTSEAEVAAVGERADGATLAIALTGVWPPHVINWEVRGATRFPFVESEAAYAAHA